jgi:putative tryptophan/tyrosine transport system substrate-binding protein
VRRREFITLLGGAAVAWPLAARAQQADRMRRVGVIQTLAGDNPEERVRIAAFLRGLQELGWRDGRNVQIEYRWGVASDVDRIRRSVAELIAFAPDVILAPGSGVVGLLLQATRTVPIVFVVVPDPVGAGFVESLARPGGNATGFMQFEYGLSGKWLELLKEIAPRVTRAALIGNPKTTPFDYFQRAAEAAAPSLAIELVPTTVENEEADIERAIESFAAVPKGGLVVLPDTTTLARRDLVVALAARNRLPAVYPFRVFVEAGGLMAYGTYVVDGYRLSATYVDRILRGAKPADLPVQTPTKYETVLNLKTAKSLGIEVPPSLLVRADEVIE